MAKIQQKRSSAAPGGSAKAPDASQLDYGELAVNFSDQDPSIFLKTSANTVVKMSGSGAIGLLGDDIDVNTISINGSLVINSLGQALFTSVTTPYFNLAALPDISAAP